MISFKVYFSEDNIRRFNCAHIPNWLEFTGILGQNFSSFYQPAHGTVQYIDAEGDKIQVSSQFEWEEMFNQFPPESHKLFKIYISSGATSQKPDTKSSPPTERGCHHRHWKGCGRGRKMVWWPYALQSRGLKLLSEKRYKEASDMFREQSGKQPENPIPVYNIACAESLLGNVSEALVYLNKAVDLGYTDLAHMLKDEDLNNIRNTEGFNAVVYRLKAAQGQPVEPVVVVSSPPPSVQVQPEIVIPPQQEPVPLDITPDPPAQSPIVTSPWAPQLEIFHEMGYLNDELIVAMLEKFQGDLQKSLMALLESSFRN